MINAYFWMAKEKVQDQGERTGAFGDNPVSEANDQYAAMTKDEAQRRYWTFYEAINYYQLTRCLSRFVFLCRMISDPSSFLDFWLFGL